MNQSCLRIGLPSGSLQESTLDLFAKAGYQITGSKRSYKPAVDDPELEIRLLRAQEISRYVEHGYLDCGITGKDWIEENNSDVELIGKLEYSKATSSPTRWVLVVPQSSQIQSVKDLQGKRIVPASHWQPRIHEKCLEEGQTRAFGLTPSGRAQCAQQGWSKNEPRKPQT